MITVTRVLDSKWPVYICVGKKEGEQVQTIEAHQANTEVAEQRIVKRLIERFDNTGLFIFVTDIRPPMKVNEFHQGE